MIKEIDGRFTCDRCGYEWSACCGDNEIPEKCECETKEPITIKKTLTLTVEYESTELSAELMDKESTQLLEDLVKRATNEGLLTGSSEMEVSSYNFKITKD